MRAFGIHGYDNVTKNDVTTSVSSMDRSMNNIRGVGVDPTDWVFALYGTINAYLDGTFNRPVKTVTRRIDVDPFVIEVRDLQIGATGPAVVRMKNTRRESSVRPRVSSRYRG